MSRKEKREADAKAKAAATAESTEGATEEATEGTEESTEATVEETKDEKKAKTIKSSASKRSGKTRKYKGQVNFKYNNKSKSAKSSGMVGATQQMPKDLANTLVKRGFGEIVKGKKED